MRSRDVSVFDDSLDAGRRCGDGKAWASSLAGKVWVMRRSHA